MFFEGGAEYAFAGKAGSEADILHGHPGIFQEIFCGGDTGIDEIFMGSEPGFPFKNTYEMELAETCPVCQFFYCEVFGKMLVNISGSLLRNAGMIAAGGFHGRIQKEGGQNIRKVFGHQGFPYRAAGSKDVIDGGKSARRRGGIRKSKDISQTGNGICVPVPGQDSVKMTPEAFPSCL